MNIFSLLHFKKKKINIKIILILVFFIVSIILGFIIPNTSNAEVKDFLPDNTSFYYHWTSKNTFLNSFDNPFLDKQLSEDKINNLNDIFNESSNNIQEIIWFRVGDNKEDHYLLLFSRLPYKFLDEIESDTYLFKKIDKRIILVTENQEVLDSVSLSDNSKFNISTFDKGINIYWKLGYSEDILNNTFPLLSTRDTFVNISEKKKKQIINIFQKNNDSFVKKDKSLLQIPKDFDSIISFNSSSTINFSNFVYDNILLSQFYSLPIYYDDKSVKEYLLKDNIIIQDENSWLMINNDHYNISNFRNSFNLEEVKKTLSDGTLYTELVFNEEEKSIDHSFKEYSYWQVDNLFGIELNKYNYLSNRQYLIEDILSDYIYLGELWKNYISNTDIVEDFIHFKVNKLPKGQLREYLEKYNVTSLDLLSYSNSMVKGYVIIF